MRRNILFIFAATLPSTGYYLEIFQITKSWNNITIDNDYRELRIMTIEELNVDLIDANIVNANEVNAPQWNFTNIDLDGNDLATVIADITSGLSWTNNVVPIVLWEDINQYNVWFIGYNWIRTSENITQYSINMYVAFWDLINDKIWQSLINFNATLIPRFTVWLRKVGSPTDNIVCNIWDSTKTILIAESTTILDWSTLTTWLTKKVFEFPRDMTPLDPNTEYFIEVHRDWPNDVSNYYEIGSWNLDQYEDWSMWIEIASSRVEIVWNDMYFKYETRYVDFLGYFSVWNIADSNLSDFVSLQNWVIGDTITWLVSWANSWFSGLKARQRYKVWDKYILSTDLPANNIALAFWKATGNQKVSDPFQIIKTPTSGTTKQFFSRNIKIKLRKVWNPVDNVKVRVETVSWWHNPTGTLLSTLEATKSWSDLTASFVEYDLFWDSWDVEITSYLDQFYFIVLERDWANSDVDYYEVDIDYWQTTWFWWDHIKYWPWFTKYGSSSCLPSSISTTPSYRTDYSYWWNTYTVKVAKVFNWTSRISTYEKKLISTQNWLFNRSCWFTWQSWTASHVYEYEFRWKTIWFTMDNYYATPSSNIVEDTDPKYTSNRHTRRQEIVWMAVSETTLVIDKR